MNLSEQEIEDGLKFYKHHGRLPRRRGTLCFFLALEESGVIEPVEVTEQEKQDLKEEIAKRRF